MLITRLKGAAVGCVALLVTAGALYAAGNYSTYPIVGGASFCVSTVGVNGQQGNTGQGGGASGTAGAYCAQTVPAGPSIVTGSELVPADTALAGGTPPQSVVLSMASLNALPLTFQAAPPTNATNAFVSGALAGGIVFTGTAAMSPTTVTLPATPIDGQQFRISSNQTIATLVVTATAASAQTINNAPTALTTSTTVAYGYNFIFHAATTSWFRLQ